jgi:hypothetical protein
LDSSSLRNVSNTKPPSIDYHHKLDKATKIQGKKNIQEGLFNLTRSITPTNKRQVIIGAIEDSPLKC